MIFYIPAERNNKIQSLELSLAHFDGFCLWLQICRTKNITLIFLICLIEISELLFFNNFLKIIFFHFSEYLRNNEIYKKNVLD